MTREELLRSMKGPELIKEADKLGVKVKCNKERNKLVEAKAARVERILAFEAEMMRQDRIDEMAFIADLNENFDEPLKDLKEKYEVEETEETEEVEEEIIPPNTLVETPAPEKIEINVIEDVVPTPKRGALIEWNGKAQNICKWGEELGISPNTLYGRIYKLGWTVDKAFTTRGRK